MSVHLCGEHFASASTLPTGVCALRNNVDAQRLEKPEDPGDVLYLIAGQSVNHQSRLSIADVADVFMPEGAENGEERV
jgi:hypothetical protein